MIQNQTNTENLKLKLIKLALNLENQTKELDLIPPQEKVPTLIQ